MLYSWKVKTKDKLNVNEEKLEHILLQMKDQTKLPNLKDKCRRFKEDVMKRQSWSYMTNDKALMEFNQPFLKLNIGKFYIWIGNKISFLQLEIRTTKSLSYIE